MTARDVLTEALRDPQVDDYLVTAKSRDEVVDVLAPVVEKYAADILASEAEWLETAHANAAEWLETAHANAAGNGFTHSFLDGFRTAATWVRLHAKHPHLLETR